MSFVNPALIAGALLFAVPLIIHLLNRQRHKRRDWAAMEFLLRAWQKQRNRLRNENLLLLLLRCLVPIVLALALARPVLEAATALIGGGGIVHHVVVIDGSYSMGLRADGAPTPFERTRTLVGRLLDGWEQDSDRNHKVTMVLAGVRPRFLVRGDLDVAAARAQYLQLQKPEDGAAELAEALQQVADALAESPDPQVRVYVFTDLQARSLGKALATPGVAAGPELADTARDAVERLQKLPAEVHWIDTGPFASARQGGVADNVQITELRVEQPAAVLRTPVEIVAMLKNRGQTTANCEVTLDVDGGEPVRKVVTLAPGAEGEADFQIAFREPGRRRVRAVLQNDALAADDERFVTVDVRDRIRVLLVDGEAGGDPVQSYRYVWQAILDPDAAALPTFALETVDTTALLSGQCVPKNHDVTVLADVERINDRAAKALVEALQAGRGVLVACGERADVDTYNLHLHGGGDGLQPFRFGSKQGGAAGSTTVRAPHIKAPDHPLLAEFEEEVYREVLQAIPIHRWCGVAADSLHPDATVVVNVTDAAQTPLLVARPFSEGKVVYMTSPVGSDLRADVWNRLDEPMVAFPLLFGMVKWLALPAMDPFLAVVGAELSCSLPVRPTDVEVQRPERDGRTKAPLAEDATPLPGGRFRLPPLADTAFAGFYVFDMVLEREAGKEPLSLPFAVNVDPEEGDLRYAAHDEARQALGLERILDKLPEAAEVVDDPERNDLGPTLLLLVLLLVVAEATLARFVSARRS